ALRNDGDYAQLLDHKGSYMDVVAYGDVSSPDTSEVLNAPDSGEAIIRTQMHIDTNKVSDFSFGLPDPKGLVPQVPLNTGVVTSDSEDTPYSLIAIFLALALLPKLKRRKVR
ncbi:MAG: hypothetical protein ACFFAU_18890, partial [Candidatus Hodarchaeota archaeon]